jgi:hypothetical protein
MKSVIHSIAFAPNGSALFVSPRESGQSVHSTAIWRPPDFNEADAKPKKLMGNHFRTATTDSRMAWLTDTSLPG